MKKFMLAMLVLISCVDDGPKEQLVTAEGIIFGHFFGECIGDKCVVMFMLTDEAVFRATNNSYPSSASGFEGTYKRMGNANFDKVKGLRTQIPGSLFSAPTVVGMPDYADGGGLYFEMTVDGERRFWLIDKTRQNVPEELHPFMAQIEQAIAALI